MDVRIEEVFGRFGKADPRWLRRYYKFIDWCKCDSKEYTERHHILPRAFIEKYIPEYVEIIDESWNIKELSARQHYIAHYILAQAVGRNMWFAFNQMQRYIQSGGRPTSILYEAARKYIAESISESNKGRKRTPEQMARHKKAMEKYRGFALREDTVGNRYFVHRDDPLVKEKNLVYYRKGSKHKLSTRKKIKENNGVAGKIGWRKRIDGKVKHLYLPEGQTPPTGYVKLSDYLKGRGVSNKYVACYDPESNRNTRVEKEEDIPEGWLRGVAPGSYAGFDLVNDPAKKTVFDFNDLIFKQVKKEDLTDLHLGHGGNSSKLVLIDRTYLFTMKEFPFRAKGRFDKIPAPHHNCGHFENLFRSNNVGKTYLEAGIESFRYNDPLLRNIDRTKVKRIYSINELPADVRSRIIGSGEDGERVSI